MGADLFSTQNIEKINKKYNENLNLYPKRKSEIEAISKDLDEDEVLSLRFVYAFMPISDIISYNPELILKTIKHSLMIRKTIPYVAKIPAELFLNYVLFYRINNENIEDYRKIFYDELFPRINNKSMKEAALEVNYWCYEKATYQATDGRTASPLTVIKRTLGRCGEESTLTVSAMRSVGIPARQCYTPRWAHCDDNHAWVEIWADGKWYYLGACEPEPILNKGWFTSAASRAMLVHSKVFSNLVSNELISKETPVYCEINNTATYGKCKKTIVKVVNNNKPLKGIDVCFELVNYGELFPIFTATTDETGSVEFNSGIGSLHIHAHDNNKFVTKLINLEVEDNIVLDFSKAASNPEKIEDFDMCPPKEDISALEEIPNEKLEIHKKRLKEAEDIRAKYESKFYNIEKAKKYCEKYEDNSDILANFLVKARGNYEEIIKFYNTDFSIDDKISILSTLREKDLADITSDLLCEYLSFSNKYKQDYNPEVYKNYILAPRIEDEMILSNRPFILDFFNKNKLEFKSPLEISDYIKHNISIMDKYEYGTLYSDIKGILTYKVSSTKSTKLLFVSICRAFGFPARLNPINGQEEYYNDNKFIPLQIAEVTSDTKLATSKLIISNKSGQDLTYFTHISVAKLINGKFESLQFWDTIIKDEFSIDVSEGNYRILTSLRQIDGCVLVKAYYLNVKSDDIKKIEVELRKDKIIDKLKYAPIENTDLNKDNLKTTLYDEMADKYCILAFTEPGKEPTEHLFNEIIELGKQYNNEALKLIITVQDKSELENKTLNKLLEVVSNTKVFIHNDDLYKSKLHKIMGVGDERLPFVIALNKERKGLFAFANYNVGTANTLLNIIEKDSKNKIN